MSTDDKKGNSKKKKRKSLVKITAIVHHYHPTQHDNRTNEVANASDNPQGKPNPSWWQRFKNGKATDHAMIIVTALVVVVTIPLVVFSFYQVIETRKATEIENRGYVTIGRTMSPLSYSVGYNLSIEWNMQNFGKTPAYRVKQISRMQLIPFPDEEFATFRTTVVDSGFILSPNDVMPKTFRAPELRQGQVDSINQGNLYFAILITYEDIFRKPHWTVGYYRYQPTPAAFLYMHTHNDTDRE